MNPSHGAGHPAPSRLSYEVKTVSYTQIDPTGRLDIESLTELWDNAGYANIKSIGPAVHELLKELLMSGDPLTQTEEVKTRSYDYAHEWGLDGEAALRAIIDIAREVAKTEIINGWVSVDVQPDRENALWAEAIAESELSPDEMKITLLYTTALLNETDPLSVQDIAEALNTESQTVKETIAAAEDKIRRYLSRQILTHRGGD